MDEMKRWIDPLPVSVPAALRDFVGGHPLVAETLVRRGFSTVDAARAFLDVRAYSPSPASDLPGLVHAVERIVPAIRDKERICVWGDFDVDGQTATTVLVETLRDLDADVFYHIPVRATESHGVKLPALQHVLDAGARLILTCDTGIDAHEAVDFANARGVDVVITDHHELPPALPDACAIVNPHLLAGDHPLASLPGVGVAFKLAEALYAHAGRAEDIVKVLDLVALGIVADVAVQTGDTRYLLQCGLARLRETRRPGLQALIKLAKINPAQINSEHIGFGLAPRLNALGRLDDANVIVEFFTTTNPTQASILASELEGLNNRRKLLSDQVFAAAQAKIEKDPSLLDDAALVLAHEVWPPGVIGIVANRLVELYNRPVVLISTSADGVGRGSARSVESCHITEALATQQHMLTSFGGHAMAAGLRIPVENIAGFRRGLSRAVAVQVGKDILPPTLSVDGYLTLSDLTLALVDDLERLSPFGPGNPSLTLASRDLRIVAKKEIGRDKQHLLLTVEDDAGTQQSVVWWRWNGASLPEDCFDLAYTVRANDYRGKRDLQVVWQDARVVESSTPAVMITSPTVEIIDYRREPHPLTLLKPLLVQHDVQIWREGPNAMATPGGVRTELQAASALVIWTLPPDPGVLRSVVTQVSPTRIYLFGVDPGLVTVESFLKHLAGLVKYALGQTEGNVSLSALVGATASRKSMVRLGLAWLAAKGLVTVVSEDGDALGLVSGGDRSDEQAVRLAAQLNDLLGEVVAYRRHFARAGVQALRPSLWESGSI